MSRPPRLKPPERNSPAGWPDSIGLAQSPPSEAQPARTLPAGIERMLGIDDLAVLLSCSRRVVERMRSAGKVPRPDIKIGKMPRWKPETIRRWIESGGEP